MIDEELSAGQVAVTNVVVDNDPAKVDAVTNALQSDETVDTAQFTSVSSDDELARIDVTLANDPFSDAASDSIPACATPSRRRPAAAPRLSAASQPRTTTPWRHSQATPRSSCR